MLANPGRCFVFLALWVGISGLTDRVGLGERDAVAGEIGFMEDFALASDRTVPLKQLVPGTEEYYYFHCLHYQNSEQFDKVGPMVTTWVARHGETGRVWQIRTRQALLTYEKNPQESLAYLRNRLQLQWNHQREVVGQEPQLPTQLDQALFSRQALLQLAATTPDSLEPFEPSALEWLIEQELSPLRRRHLLQLLERPDYPQLVKLIVDDLQFANSPGFGAFPVHRQLLRVQLDACLAAKPDLLNDSNFVSIYLAKLHPTPDEDWQHDSKSLEAFLDRMIGFSSKLAPVHNSLKAHLLYHRLLLDRQRGQYSKERFLQYLNLPRQVGYGAKRWLERDENVRFSANLATDFRPLTLLPPVGNDEPLIRSFLAHFLLDAKDTKEFEPYINDIYLKQLFAETKILNGLGEPEQWASLLPPELFQQLKERVDLDFAFTNQTQFAADEPVRLDIDVKNVSTLLVKVFEINTQSYYRQQLREVETDINLDGLVANEEQTHNYGEPALRRIKRHFEFKNLNRPGVYVIDFIGNGRSSRAVIRKGQLRNVVATGPSGQEFTIFDERRQQVEDATLWLGGHEYRPDEDGRITVPFSTAPGRTPIVLSRGDFSYLDHFQHLGEAYAFNVGFYVDRESLLKSHFKRQNAQLVIRPGLSINGVRVSVTMLEDVKLTITSLDLDGVPTTQEIPGVKLFEDRETTHEFQVPQRLASVQFTLQAKVKSLSTNTKLDLADSQTFTLNGIDRTEKIEDLYLARFGDDYVIDLLGRTGEPKVSRPVQLVLKHRDYKHPIHVTLKSDPSGRVHLGPLSGVYSVTATGPENTVESWVLSGDRHTYPSSVHARQGETITLPYLGKSQGPSRSELSLLELRGETFVADRFEALKIERGLLQIHGLPAGDYQLLLKGVHGPIRMRIVDGPQLGTHVLGSLRQLELRPLPPVQIEQIASEKQPIDGKEADVITIRLANASKFTRVHLFGTRFWPIHSAFEQLSRVRGPELYHFRRFPAESQYLTGRNIGDEYRYIIDRKFARHFPGNMLDRPSLLLNPWAVRSTETGEQLAAGGDNFAPANQPPPASAAADPAAALRAQQALGQHWNLDFLAEAAAVLVNLVPDKDGVIRVPREALGRHQHLHVVAVDPLNTTYRSLALDDRKNAGEGKTRILDLRLVKSFDPQRHFTQQKQISVLAAGQPFVIQDVTTSRFEIYDSIAKAYGLYATLSKGAYLAEFRFLLEWPQLKPEQKRTYYSKYASHELTFFLFRKDPAFFQEVIKPYLTNKKDHTFLDLWLLQAPLDEYTQPWRHGQLNMAERILLGQRLPAERPHMLRHVRDQFQLLPPNLDQFITLFDTAVKGSALDTANALGDYGNSVISERELLLGIKVASGSQFAEFDVSGRLESGGGMGGGGRGLARASRNPGDVNADEPEQHDKKWSSLKRKAKNGSTRADDFVESHDVDGLVDELYSDPSNGRDISFLHGRRSGEELRRKLYQKLDKTQEWAENNYHHLTIDQQNAQLIAVNAFWRDVAEAEPGQPFLSRNLAEVSRTFSEMLLALGLLDLPFEAGKHETAFDGVKMTLKPASPMVVYHEEIRDAKPAAAAVPILISQNFFRYGDRHRQENNEQIDKFVSEEFLTQAVYGCQIVVTNPTSARQKLSALLQIPRGAIPVLNGQYTRSVQMNLEPYHTQTVEYYFYFPLAGKFPHYPVQVAKNEDLIASAAPFEFNVVDKPTRIDTESWDYVSQNGSDEDVLRFLSGHNVAQLNLEKIAFRMRDARFFGAAIELLSLRHAYQHTLWSYSLQHNTVAAAREFLQHSDGLVNECGGRLNSALVSIDPVARRSFEHLEYMPLVNPRAHALGKRRQILNDRFSQQYHRYLEQLSFTRELSDDDWMAVTYYLLLQDRVEEALSTFGKVNANKLETRLQYDYLAAYLDFYTDDHRLARGIATKYVDHPVDRWRNAFTAIRTQLDEIDGGETKVVNPDDRNQQQTQLAASEPSLDFQIDARQLVIQYQNLKSATVNYYLMDVELLFSHNPFVQQFSGQFSSIRPNQTQELQFPEKQTTVKIAMPDSLHNKNVLVEITAGGQTKTQAYYSHSLAVQLIENYGQVKVADLKSGAPISKAYVKVYAQMQDGQVRFYKDGYTDLRGRFDYTSLNTNELEIVSKFAILVLTESTGAVVREANPPKR